MTAGMAKREVGSDSAWDRSPICSRTDSTSARSIIGVRCIAVSMSRSSAATCSRPCRQNSPPTPLTGSQAKIEAPKERGPDGDLEGGGQLSILEETRAAGGLLPEI